MDQTRHTALSCDNDVPLCLFPRDEERVHVATHGIGLILSAAAFVYLLVQVVAGDFSALHGTAVGVYGITLVLLYGASTCYHAAVRHETKRLLRIADHCCIYLLIAGTYTPFMLFVLGGRLGWSLLAVVWISAIAGVLLKVFRPGRFAVLSVVLYVMMGWVCLVAIVPLIRQMAPVSFLWLFFGGMFYTIGVYFYALDRLRWFHTIWHLFVLAGSTCQFIALARHLTLMS